MLHLITLSYCGKAAFQALLRSNFPKTNTVNVRLEVASSDFQHAPPHHTRIAARLPFRLHYGRKCIDSRKRWFQHGDDRCGRDGGSINAVLDLKFGQEVRKIGRRRFLASKISEVSIYSRPRGRFGTPDLKGAHSCLPHQLGFHRS
uniref:Uncharacterized protein n=1 Tax=Rhipicephalus zambeziensis TaxID=60191 RepID=A0A224YFM7_9ACAR